MTQLIVPNRGTLIEGVRLPKWQTPAAEVAIKSMSKVVQLLPDSSKAGAFAMAVAHEMNKLTAECTPMSVVNAACNCAALGLIPGGVLGHAYFVPKKKNRDDRYAECQLWPGYRGYIHLAYQTGFLRDIYADVVYDGEPVDTWVDDSGRHIKHDINSRIDQGEQGRTVRCSYIVWNAVTGGRGVFVVPGKELYDLKRKQGNVWNSHFVAMACKTPVRRGWRFWHVSGEGGNRLAYAARLDDQAEMGEEQSQAYLIDVEPSLTTPQSGGLLDDLEDAETEPAVEETSFESFRRLIESTPDTDEKAINDLYEDVAHALSGGELTEDEAHGLRAMLSQKIPFA